jgi:hypothetical protein
MLKQTPKKRVLFVRRPALSLLALFGVFCLALTTLSRPLAANAAALNTVNFQARLQTSAGAVVPDGSYNVEFKLYAASSGGSAIWTETYLNSNSEGLDTVNGYLSTSLGSVSAFSSSIDWSQQLYVTMNIGGTGNSASWDGEMNPRLALTAIPYAFQAGQLVKTHASNGFSSNLSIQAPTGGNQTFVIQDQGAAGTYNLLTTNTALGSFVQLQGSTPGTAQTGNLNITGTSIAGGFQGGSLDTASAGTLAIGNSNATTINIGTNNAGHTIAVGTGTGTQAVTIGSTSGSSSLVLQGGSGNVSVNVGAGGFYINNAGVQVAGVSNNGSWLIQPSANSGSAFMIKNADGSKTELIVDTSTDTVTTKQLDVASGYNINVVNGALTLGSTTQVNFHTPGGSDVATKINIPIFDPGSYGQVIAMGLPSSAATTSRVITVVDARTSAHQPSIALLDPSENQIFGLSWDGDNCNTNVNCAGLLKSTGNSVGLNANGYTGARLYNAGSTSELLLGASSGSTGLLSLLNSSNGNKVSIKAGATSNDYVIVTPTNVGSTGQCVTLASVSGQTQTLGYADCNANAFVQGGSSFGTTGVLGTADSQNLNIVTNGTARISINNSGDQIVLGTAGGDTTGTILVLGKKTTSGDPTVVDGAMYYNTNSGGFRCGVAGAWVNCIGGLLTGSTAVNSSVNNTASETAFSSSYSIPANFCANGRILRLKAYGTYGTNSGSQNVTIRVKLGSTVIATSDTSSNLTASLTGKSWTLDSDVICANAAGSSATVSAQGSIFMGGSDTFGLPYGTSTIATDSAQTLTVTAQWNNANSSNDITLQSFVLQAVGP